MKMMEKNISHPLMHRSVNYTVASVCSSKSPLCINVNIITRYSETFNTIFRDKFLSSEGPQTGHQRITLNAPSQPFYLEVTQLMEAFQQDWSTCHGIPHLQRLLLGISEGPVG